MSLPAMQQPGTPGGGAWPLRVTLEGARSGIESDLCAACPRGPKGCCTYPPVYTLQEIGLVASTPGGTEWILSEIRAGRLWVEPEALRPASDNWGCTYLTRVGCRAPRPYRPAQCNFYICPDAIAAAGLDRSGPDLPRQVRDFQYARRERWSRRLAAALRRLGLLPLDPDRADEWLPVLARLHRTLERGARRAGRELPAGQVHTFGDHLPAGHAVSA